mmetsp:Transcript_130442/g.244051  ORF Transcript_130442/g.244051 Transcript_130442/m.244051 type:complete len:105 (+) Transcript_130442:2-316(+)
MQNLDPIGMSKASVSFEVPRNASLLTAYEFCNKHGLWKGPTVQVPKSSNTEASEPKDSDVDMTFVILWIVVGIVIFVILAFTISYICKHAPKSVNVQQGAASAV